MINTEWTATRTGEGRWKAGYFEQGRWNDVAVVPSKSAWDVLPRNHWRCWEQRAGEQLEGDSDDGGLFINHAHNEISASGRRCPKSGKICSVDVGYHLDLSGCVRTACPWCMHICIKLSGQLSADMTAT